MMSGFLTGLSSNAHLTGLAKPLPSEAAWSSSPLRPSTAAAVDREADEALHLAAERAKMRAESDDVKVHLAAERAKMREERAAVEAQEARLCEAEQLEIELDAAQAKVAAEAALHEVATAAALREVATAAAMLPSALPRYGSP